MPNRLTKILAEFTSKGYVIAPAGYGKTHLIALAVKESKERQLILTHTFAGVNSIKNKMVALNVPASKYQVDTIASWVLRLCLAYPKTSGWATDKPTNDEWNELYNSFYFLVAKSFIRRVISITYAGIYVDEYQDCSDFQHRIVCSLADFLPCRILGDPLQAIFDFSDIPVDWDVSIKPHFTCLGKLEIPWRWKNAGAEELGDWLKTAREALETGKQIDFEKLPTGVNRLLIKVEPNDLQQQRNILYKFLKYENSVIALYAGKHKYKTHKLANNMAGKFSSIEEVEGKALFDFLREFQSAKTTSEKFLLAVEFAKKCMTNVGKTLRNGTKQGKIAKVTKSTNISVLPILDSANLYLIDPTSNHLRDFFYRIKEHPETNVYRIDLLNRFFNVLRIHINGEAPTLCDAADIYQREFRHSGRPVKHKKLIATPLLVKGLEYDHAILLEADSLSPKELYVAITRGSKSLTIITTKNSLPTN